MDSSELRFSKTRTFLWPIYRSELKKFIPMLLMAFFISTNYHLLRILKDPLVITINSSGAEAIPFLKVWAMLPMAILLTFLFTKLSRHLSREKVFYIMTFFFLGFFALFTFVLYPLRDEIQPNALANQIQVMMPKGLQGLVDVFRNWTISSFYVMSELWSAMIFSVLFWAFVNEITKVHEAKRFYGLLSIGTNMAGIFIGKLSSYLARLSYVSTMPGDTQEEQLLILCTILLLSSGACILLLFNWMQKHVLTDPESYHPTTRQEAIERQKNISLSTSFKYLAQSRYVLCIAIIVVAYNIVINLTEVAWKSQLAQQYPGQNQLMGYFGEVTSSIGILATIMAFVSSYLIRRLGWTFTALITPIILLVTTLGFFSFLLFGRNMQSVLYDMLQTTPLAMTVFFGSAQNVLSRASKYTVFDATKELAFTPLTSDEKINAKAVIDGVGSRFGKSGGALMYQVLLVVFSGIAGTTPYVAGLILLFIAIWIFSVRILGSKIKPLLYKQENRSV